MPDLAVEHPSLLPKEQPYLRIERRSFLRTFRIHRVHAGTRSDRAAAVLTYFRHETRSVAARRGVRVAKWLGDGAMLVGVEAGPSVALGAHLIAQLVRSAAPCCRYRDRNALLFEGDDYIGEPVNLAARLCGAAIRASARCMARADLPTGSRLRVRTPSTQRPRHRPRRSTTATFCAVSLSRARLVRSAL